MNKNDIKRRATKRATSRIAFYAFATTALVLAAAPAGAAFVSAPHFGGPRAFTVNPNTARFPRIQSNHDNAEMAETTASVPHCKRHKRRKIKKLNCAE